MPYKRKCSVLEYSEVLLDNKILMSKINEKCLFFLPPPSNILFLYILPLLFLRVTQNSYPIHLPNMCKCMNILFYGVSLAYICSKWWFGWNGIIAFSWTLFYLRKICLFSLFILLQFISHGEPVILIYFLTAIIQIYSVKFEKYSNSCQKKLDHFCQYKNIQIDYTHLR